MQKTKEILLAFYGDDFTGSTDALEFLTRAGARTVLFLDNPTEEQLIKYKDLDAVGVAGMTRAMTPEKMEMTLREAFAAIAKLRPRHVHYKVCSTFDSSPRIGNIGTAISVGNHIFPHSFTPLLVAAPNLGRYSAFGNLYARMGIGSQGDIFRLDRHPSMSNHPTTPAEESDLRLHLAKQTDQSMGLIDLTDLEKPVEAIGEKIASEVRAGKELIFVDAMYEHQMATIGKVLDSYGKKERPFFSVGSSGIEKALGDHWSNEGILQQRNEWQELRECSPMLVLSGSCSPVTAEQIRWAVDAGFEEVAVELSGLTEEELRQRIAQHAREVSALLGQGKSVILHTCIGPDDLRLSESKALFQRLKLDDWARRIKTTAVLGRVLGESARLALEENPVKRLVIAGGDTSGVVARQLGIQAVEMIAPVFTGAPMCRAYAPGSPVDGIEVNLKGGQVGDPTYFCALKQGKSKMKTEDISNLEPKTT